MIITKELLEAEIERLEKMSKKDIDDFIGQKDADSLLHNGDVLSEDACKVLFFSDLPISINAKKALIKNLASSAGGVLPPLSAELHCPRCGKLHPAIRITKTAIVQGSLSPSSFLDKKFDWDFMLEDECFERNQDGLLCQNCFDKVKEEVEKEASEILNKPVEELLKLIIEQERLPRHERTALINKILYWDWAKVDGEKRVVHIGTRCSSIDWTWEDREYRKKIEERELLKRQKKEERRIAREEKIQKAHEEYVARLDQIGLSNNMLPSAPESEFFIMSRVLRDISFLRETCLIITPVMFANENLRKIFTVIKDFSDNGVLHMGLSDEAAFFLIKKLIEERYGHTEMMNLMLPFDQMRRPEQSTKSERERHINELLKKYVERNLYIVAQRIQQTVHRGNNSPFMLLQYASEKLKALSEIAETTEELRSEFPEFPGSRLMPFGKYKGREVMEIMEKDPDYIEWIMTNLRNPFILTDEEQKYFEIFRSKT